MWEAEEGSHSQRGLGCLRGTTQESQGLRLEAGAAEAAKPSQLHHHLSHQTSPGPLWALSIVIQEVSLLRQMIPSAILPLGTQEAIVVETQVVGREEQHLF